jgi:hypothetical protein
VKINKKDRQKEMLIQYQLYLEMQRECKPLETKLLRIQHLHDSLIVV